MEGAVGAEHNTVPRTGPFQFLCLSTKTDTWLLAKCGPVHVPVAYALSPFISAGADFPAPVRFEGSTGSSEASRCGIAAELRGQRM